MAQSAPAAESKRARNQAARRERVIAAAVDLASEGGYDAVQMRDVAAQADVALGTLYRYFPSKDHLLIAALAEQVSTLQRRLAQKPPRGTSAADRVVDVLHRASRALEREPQLTAALVNALSSADPSVAEAKQEVSDILAAVIADAVDHDALANSEDVVRVLGHVWFAALVSWVGGMAPTGQMGDDLEITARLILDR
ncbi:MAG TPA: TetR family transcriptional regulator [Acidimicrobiales bacterium]|nr:TetR family transcriptional regulator [Acidimicrobiales bacterium]